MQPVRTCPRINNKIDAGLLFEINKRLKLRELQTHRGELVLLIRFRDTVFNVEANGTCLKKAPCIFLNLLRVLRISSLEIRRHRNIDPSHRIGDNLHQIIQRDILAVRIAERIRDACARCRNTVKALLLVYVRTARIP